jgi:Baseplate wedge protein gp25
MSGPVVSSARPALPALAVGWPLLPTPDADGALAWPTAAISVKQMIEVILRTAPGEQLMRPEFGAGLVRLVPEPNTLATRARRSRSPPRSNSGSRASCSTASMSTRVPIRASSWSPSRIATD